MVWGLVPARVLCPQSTCGGKSEDESTTIIDFQFQVKASYMEKAQIPVSTVLQITSHRIWLCLFHGKQLLYSATNANLDSIH
jgi:hypothetical protein